MVIHTYEQNGETYSFVPPIEVGSHSVDTLEKLATIAILGSNVTAEELRLTTPLAKMFLDKYPLDSALALNSLLIGKHKVSKL